MTDDSSTAPEHQVLVAQLAQALGETESEPLAQLGRIVERCGGAQALLWLQQAEQIEEAGGEMLPDKSRRRTKGGVFFRIVRRAVLGADRRYIFPAFRQPGKGSTAKTTPAAAPLPAATWADREQLISEAQQQPGKATNVKITVIGRPSKTVERQGFTLLVLAHAGTLPALPKGMPLPAQALPTQYIVYVAAKQWAKVKAALVNEQDVLIAEGIPLLDPKYAAITVFATNTTTKLLQQQKRAAPERAGEN